ncbi:MAG: efflux RND transporter permease subunit [Thermoguttaceae bacterium]
MINRLIRWALHNRLVVILLAAGLLGYGIHAFREVNVEAYPDPAPAIVEVVARYPGASAEEVERQVTIPLEVALAGMPGLAITRTQSLFELCYVSNEFEYGVDPAAARQEVLNRLRLADLPAGVAPDISPRSPTGEIFRYVLVGPKDSAGRDIYDPNDLKSLQDMTLEKLFRRLPRVVDVTSFGGTVKRYEIHPDPARMQRYGITLQQLKDAIASNNSNVGGDYIVEGGAAHVVRSLGMLGMGQDPMETAMGMKDPVAARNYLRAEEERRIREIRQIVLSATNNVPVRVNDVVEGGPLRAGSPPGKQGVVMGYQTRLGHVMRSFPLRDAQGREVLDARGRRVWHDDDEVVEGIVLLRKGEQSLPALDDIHALVKQLHEIPGRLLPGVKIEPYYDRTELIGVTTGTVQENLLAGMALVTVVLLLFLSNVRTALIVAINVPLALLFAVAVLFLRGKSANLLSIGAVDFGIIVDSSVIMVENIYRHLSRGVDAHLPIDQRILRASGEVQRSLAFSTAVMVCAFLPLFTMAGPEGQIFGPMADTYAFALAGALLLALVLSPVLCSLLLSKVKPRPDNWLVRTLQAAFLRQLDRCLRHRVLTLGVFALIVAATAAVVPMLGREFLPELEEGNIWIAGTFPLKTSLDEVCHGVKIMRSIVERYPECEQMISEVGRPDDGTDPSGFYGTESYVPLKPHDQWPIPPGQTRPRTKDELVDALNREIAHTLVATDWNFSQNIRNNVNETLSGGRQGNNSVRIIGPDLQELENTADRIVLALRNIHGLENVGAFHILGQSNLNLPVDRDKCARWNLNVSDVQAVVDTAVGGKAFSQMIEGERSFDITLRYPRALRSNLDAILDIPVEVSKNTVVNSQSSGQGSTPVSGPTSGPSPTGSSAALPPLTGSSSNAPMNDLSRTPRRRLRDLLTPLGPDGRFDEHGSFLQRGASDICREQGERLIVVKFDIHDRDLAGAVAEAKKATKDLVHAPCRLSWGGEFQEMEQAESRMRIVIPLAVALVAVLLYMAFGSLVDVLIVLSNVVALACGGVWALLLTQTNFSISAAVGFISIFGVAVMDAILQVSSFHRARLEGKPLEEAVVHGSLLRLRPIMMTALTAIFGLMPAALSTRIGAQSQRPLAIVVIGGMIMALALNRYLTPVLYSVLRRHPPSEEATAWGEVE